MHFSARFIFSRKELILSVDYISISYNKERLILNQQNIGDVLYLTLPSPDFIEAAVYLFSFLSGYIYMHLKRVFCNTIMILQTEKQENFPLTYKNTCSTIE